MSLTWPLWDAGRSRAEQAAALAQADAIQHRVREFDDIVAVEVRDRLMAITTSREALVASEQAVTAATEARRVLEERFAAETPFCALGHRARVLHGRLEDLPRRAQYDRIVSGLPLNNFAVSDVERILAAFRGLSRPGGVLSFFEYAAIRPARALVSGREERARLRGIGRTLAGLLEAHEIRRDLVWRNLPPAVVHHVRFGS